MQDFTVTVGCAFIVIEISTPFICSRWFMFDHKIPSGHILHTTNTILLSFFFIFGRVFFQLYVIAYYAAPWIYYMYNVAEGVSQLYLLILLEMQASVLINVILNFYWSFLIIRQIIRIVLRGAKSDTTYSTDGQAETAGEKAALEER